MLRQEGATMNKWRCVVCGYIYDPDEGDEDNDIAPGTPFGDLPPDWTCPDCGASQEEFEEMDPDE
jgi:rubredoxin